MSQSTIDIDAYLHTHEQLQQVIEGLSEEQLKWKATPTEWSVTEVLAHLADHNIVVSFRIRQLLSGSENRLPAFSQDAWVAGQLANGGNAQDILNVFKALLVYNSLLLRRLAIVDWQRTATHFNGATVSLATIITSFIAHVQTHLNQINRIKLGAGVVDVG